MVCSLDDFKKEEEENNNKLFQLHENLDEYVQGKHLNGGCYGYAAAK